MFFDNVQLAQRKSTSLRLLPPVPDTGWTPPREFPNLSAAVALSLDTETKDPELLEAGPGWARGKGHIVGASLAAIDRHGNRGKWYFPVRHEVEGHDNLDPANVFPFLKYWLETPHLPKVGANLLYDIGWLTTEGIEVKGQLNDVQFAEALLDETALVALETLAHKYLGLHKVTDALYDWIVKAYAPKKHRERGEIWRSPPRLVGYYAEADADLPLSILGCQLPEIRAQELDYVYRMECDIIPLLIQMRRAGVSVDLDKASEVHARLIAEQTQLYDEIQRQFGYRINSVSSGAELAALFDHVGIPYLRTEPSKSYPNGQPSFQKEWLENLHHPLGDLVRDIRERDKLCGTFIESYIFDKHVNGKLFPQFHPLKGDENGTVVGRFASSDPNLQNIPSRTKLGKLLRTMFIPDRGHHEWRKFDYSQIHYRILADCAVDKGDGSADALRARYNNDPDTDYHLEVYKRVAPLMGWSTDYTQVPNEYGKLEFNEEIKTKRRPVKNYNFGLLYGQGKAALEYKSGLNAQETALFSENYFKAAPYVKPTMAMIANEVQLNGYVTTLLGRRVRFNLWEPNVRGMRADPLPLGAALAAWGSNIRRAYDYRGVNYRFQGSEPDIMKKGMRDLWNSGVFNYIGVPRLTVHDECDYSVMDDSPQTNEAFRFVQQTMQDAIKLRVPVKVDMSRGPNWGKAD